MEFNELFYKEGLLWVALIFGGYGSTMIATDFYKGAISLTLCALILVCRAFVKTHFVALSKKKK